MKKILKTFFMILTVVLAFTVVSCSCEACNGEEDVPTPEPPKVKDYTDPTDMSFRDAIGVNGAVTCANNLVSKVGLDVLQAGGNAYDAAVAMSFALGVLEPNASGIGGGGVMTAYDATNKKYVFYNFREFTPGNMDHSKVTDHLELSFGGKASAVPMEVSGLLDIYENLGSKNLTLKQLMQPSIDYARNGFDVTDRLVENMVFNIMSQRASEECLKIYGKYSSSGELQRNKRVGEQIVNEGLANVLDAIAEKGKDGFYSGWVAEAIVEAVQENGGFMSLEDLTKAKDMVIISEPLHSTYNGYDIYTSQLPAAGGIVLTETLNILEAYTKQTGKSLSSLGFGSAEYIHAYATASQLAYADKRYYIGDNGINPATSKPFINVPVEGLTSKEYAKARFNGAFSETESFCKDMNTDFGAANGADPWDYEHTVTEKQEYLYPEQAVDVGTTSLSVTDKFGNVVSITKTINKYWGSYVMPKNTGFMLNNQMDDFTDNVLSVNRIEPYKRPISSMAPTIIAKDGKIMMTVGCPGSGTIPNAICQVILNVLDFGMNIQEALEARRVQCIATEDADMDYYYKTPYDNTTYKFMTLEESPDLWGNDVLDAIRAKKYHLEVSGHVTHVYGLTITYNTDGSVKEIKAGADNRKDGKALAY